MTLGKSFEIDFKGSVPDEAYIRRVKDCGGWSNATNTKFTPKNDCDFLLFINRRLYLLELKSHLGRSIPEKEIPQLEELVKVQKPFVLPCLVLNYRDYNLTYILSAQRATECLQTRKSIPLSWCEDYGKVIPQTLKRTHYKYNLEIL